MKNIKWQRWKNPVRKNSDRSFVRMTTFGPDAVRLTAGDKNSLRWWVGHTNFYVSDKVRDVIKSVPGVEILEVFSPYRFRLCPGLNFNSDLVLRNIERSLCGEATMAGIPAEHCVDIAKQRIDFLASEANWLIYVLPNGKFESYSTKCEEEFLSMLAKYDEVEKAIGGFIMTA